MLNDILKQLSENPNAIVELLEYFGCAKIKQNARYILFARDDRPESGLSISIPLDDNEACFVRDFARNEWHNIISFLCKEKKLKFKDVLRAVKNILGLDDTWNPKPKTYQLFGGVYSSIIRKIDAPIKVYNEDILDQYLAFGSERFLKDKISLEVQSKFKIGYDINSDRITIPIRDQHGDIMGIKGRRNYQPESDDDPKYLYLVPCQMSRTLYGYSENYGDMYGGTIMVFESEKSVLQCASYGYNNAVALGSNNLSEHQAKMLLSLNPKRIIFMLDNDLPLEQTKRNAEVLKSVCTMRDLQIDYFDWTECLDLSSKSSPSDEGKEVLDNILDENIKNIEEIE